MSRVNLKLVIIPDNHELHEIFNYDPNKYGSIFSTAGEINVNKVKEEYSILYTDKVFKSIQINTLMDNICALFNKNLPGFEVYLSIIYLYETNADNPLTSMDFKVTDMMMQMDRYMYNNPDFSPGSRFNFVYERHKLFIDMILDLENMKEQFVENMEAKKEAANKQKVEEVRIRDLIDPNLGRVAEPMNQTEDIMGIYPFFVDDEDEYSSKKKKKKKIHYDSSRVIKAAGNPKKTYRRHGVVVCSNKKAIHKDEAVIKDFLKDFIPGSSGWKKDLRKDLLKRWMNVYVVTKGQLKHLEKKHRKYYRRKDNSVRNEKILDFTQKMLTVPVNNWNNPNK